MGLGLWLKKFIIKPDGEAVFTCGDADGDTAADYYFREMAFWSAVRFIGGAVAKCEFRTFCKDKEIFGDEYYRLNIQPNINENSTRFYQKLVGRLCVDNEALIIEDPSSSGLLIADKFEKDVRAIAPWTFKGVEASGFKFSKTFSMNEVMYFQLNNDNIKALLDGMYLNYEKLLKSALKSFSRNRGRKGILNINAFRAGSIESQATELRMLNQRFKTMFEAENGIAVIEKNQSFQDLSSAVRDVESSRDIKEMVNDIYDYTANAFGIAPAILRGNSTGLREAIDMTLTFGVDPFVDLIETEINAKLYGRKNYAAGTKCIIDSSTIKHIDIIDLAENGGKLVANGFYSINELRRKLKEPPISEKWADEHYMTLNNMKASDMAGKDGMDAEQTT